MPPRGFAQNGEIPAGATSLKYVLLKYEVIKGRFQLSGP